jgi:hypothetical protein
MQKEMTVLSRHLLGGTKENRELPQSVQVVFRPRFELRTSEHEFRGSPLCKPAHHTLLTCCLFNDAFYISECILWKGRTINGYVRKAVEARALSWRE